MLMQGTEETGKTRTEQEEERVYLTDVEGYFKRSGTDENGNQWTEFEVDHLALQEPGRCNICGDVIEFGWLCLDDGSVEVCAHHVVLVEEIPQA